MPFKSKKQERWMWANKPDMARQWEEDSKKQVKNKQTSTKKKKK